MDNQILEQTIDDNYIKQYYQEIKNGNIVAGADIKKVLRWLISGMNNPKYKMDFIEADLRIDFIQSNIKLTKAPFFGKPMNLMLWQKAWLTALYSFHIEVMENETDTIWVKRFTETLLLIARKNAKSETSSGVGLSDLFLLPSGSDICVSSNDDNQSKLVYDAVATMREMLDAKNTFSRKTQKLIECKNKNTIFRMSEKMKNTEGRNIASAIIDEINMMSKDMFIINSINQSMSIKDEHLTIYITSEGFVDDGALDQLKKRGKAIIDGESDEDRYLPMMYTQDESEAEIFEALDNNDLKIFQKSNPSLGTIKKYQYIKENLIKAKTDKYHKIWVLNKDLNMKLGSSISYLRTSDYGYEQEEFDLETFRDCVCIGGVDMAEAYDLNCLTLLFKTRNKETNDIDKNFYIHQHYWIPENKLKDSKDKIDYREMAYLGLLTIVDGYDVDTKIIADYLLSLQTTYGIIPMITGFDQKFSQSFKSGMMNCGYPVEVIQQSAEMLNNSIRYTEAAFMNEKIQYNNNPILKWCIGNSSILLNNKQQALLIKQNNDSKNRIDGIVSLIICIESYLRHRDEFSNYIKVIK